MKRNIWIAIVSLACLLPVLAAGAQTITTIGEINAVDADGNPTFPGLNTMDEYTIEGRVICDPAVFNAEEDTSFILFMQDDTGGIQVYSGAWYGGGLSAYPIELQVGDLIRVTGLTGSYGGKTNINERHNPDQKFTIEIANAVREEPKPIELETLKDANDFDPTRKTGGEYYQGRLVMFKNVSITEGEWGQGATLTVSDPLGNTCAVELRAGTKIGENPQPSGLLNIIGVFDQEDADGPATAGYVLWPRSIDDFQSVNSSGLESWDVYQ